MSFRMNTVLDYRHCMDRLEAAAVGTKRNDTRGSNEHDDDGMQAVEELDRVIDGPLFYVDESQESLDNETWSEIQENSQKTNDIHKAIILRCDSVSSLDVLLRVIEKVQSTMGSTKMVEIVECGVGNVTVSVC